MPVTRLDLPGAWYTDATPDRSWAALYGGTKIKTSQGDVPLPPGGDLLYLRCHVYNGVLSLAGQGHNDGTAWLWNGLQWLACGETYGTSPCAFGLAWLYISRPQATDNVALVHPSSGQAFGAFSQRVGSRGIADVNDTGLIHSVDDWYGVDGFAEYTQIGNVRIGQGAQGGLVARVGTGPLRLVEPGSVQFIRVSRDGDTLAVSAWKDRAGAAVVQWLTVADLNALPLVSTVTDPPPPIVVPPVPVEPDPMPLPNHLAALQSMRAAYPPTLDAVQAVALLNRFAWTFQHEGWGLLAKPNGNHGPQPTTGVLCSCDWLTNTNGLGMDALRDGPDATTGERGEAGVTWSDGEPYDVSRFVAPVAPVDEDEDDSTDPPPVVDPPPPGRSLADLWTLVEAQGHLIADLQGLAAGLMVEGTTDAAGGGFLSKAHTHPFRAKVKKA